MSWIRTRIVATHAGILTSQRSTGPYGTGFDALTTLPYQSDWQIEGEIALDLESNSAASVVNFSPVTFSAQDPSTSELLRTL